MTLRPMKTNVRAILGLTGGTFGKVIIAEPHILPDVLTVHNHAACGELVIRVRDLSAFRAGVKSGVSGIHAGILP